MQYGIWNVCSHTHVDFAAIHPYGWCLACPLLRASLHGAQLHPTSNPTPSPGPLPCPPHASPHCGPGPRNSLCSQPPSRPHRRPLSLHSRSPRGQIPPLGGQALLRAPSPTTRWHGPHPPALGLVATRWMGCDRRPHPLTHADQHSPVTPELWSQPAGNTAVPCPTLSVPQCPDPKVSGLEWDTAAASAPSPVQCMQYLLSPQPKPVSPHPPLQWSLRLLSTVHMLSDLPLARPP